MGLAILCLCLQASVAFRRVGGTGKSSKAKINTDGHTISEQVQNSTDSVTNSTMVATPGEVVFESGDTVRSRRSGDPSGDGRITEENDDGTVDVVWTVHD